ncbi:MAG TPA: PQQ-binding-like beta-propeller repeat protein [Actinomycetota bacterium]|nr:PQQ-binding-like beta-propeller repeat protein [Actinomycetota bacterium]
MPRRAPLILVACLAAALLPTGPTSAHEAECARPTLGGSWTRMGNDLQNTRAQTAEHYLDPLHVAQLRPAWTFDANRWTRGRNNEITGYPIVADGCVYVGSSTGNRAPGWVFAMDADTGDLVWKRHVPDGGVYSTLAVEDGRVFAFVSRIDAPYVLALDQATGKELWKTTVDHQIGSDAVSSPIVYDGMVWVGVSGTAAEGDESERHGFQGSFSLLDAVTGEVIRKTWAIPPSEWEDGYAGAAMWGTIAIDPETKTGFIGTGNPFDYEDEHDHTNAVVKVDLDRQSPTFGEIVGSYKGDVEEYFPDLADTLPCEEFEEMEDVFVAGFECGNLDLDFGSTPNIFRDSTGRKLVGAGQKSGVYHVFDPETMEPVYKSLLGFPSPVGGIVGSAAVADGAIYGPHTVGGYLWSIDADDGALRWVSPTADGIHWGNPVTYANRVVYTVDLKGFLTANDSISGAPLLAWPIPLGSETRTDPAITWGGVTVARNSVYASVGVGLTSAGLPSMPNGFVVAFLPQTVSL